VVGLLGRWNKLTPSVVGTEEVFSGRVKVFCMERRPSVPVGVGTTILRTGEKGGSKP